MILINNLSCGYGGERVIEGVNLKVQEGEIVSIIGPNGVGKTTFFKTILGLIPALEGDIFFDKHAMTDYTIKDLAKQVAYIPQTLVTSFDFTVFDVVLMGRTAHLGWLSNPSTADYDMCDQCLRMLGVEALSNRRFNRLSGGERQLVLIARALAQDAKTIMMDEPASNLDYGNQSNVLQKIKQLANQGKSVIMTTHFPNHVLMLDSRVCAIKDRHATIGTAKEMITKKQFKTLFNTDVEIIETDNNMGGRLRGCIPVM
jgi:iron complex transport system ATP-binding protein